MPMLETLKHAYRTLGSSRPVPAISCPKKIISGMTGPKPEQTQLVVTSAAKKVYKEAAQRFVTPAT